MQGISPSFCTCFSQKSAKEALNVTTSANVNTAERCIEGGLLPAGSNSSLGSGLHQKQIATLQGVFTSACFGSLTHKPCQFAVSGLDPGFFQRPICDMLHYSWKLE